jgi:hypothetical protein
MRFIHPNIDLLRIFGAQDSAEAHRETAHSCKAC